MDVLREVPLSIDEPQELPDVLDYRGRYDAFRAGPGEQRHDDAHAGRRLSCP